MSAGARALTVLVRGYQAWLSPLLGPRCRFYPSCSAYAVTALRRFRPVKGTWLALKRLGRCHPWTPGGVDHVPQRPSVDTTRPGTGAPAPLDPAPPFPAARER